MLQLHRVIPSTRPWHSIRFASQLGQNITENQTVKTTGAASDAKSAHSSRPSILSRLSDKTHLRTRRVTGTEQQSPHAPSEVMADAHRKPRPRTTSFVSARSAQKRDHAAKKWFTDIRELDISSASVDQPEDFGSLQPKKRRFGTPKQHEMRPRTDLNALFAPSTVRSATSLRVQTKRELGGDYSSYLPDGYADPYRLPVTYARLVLGRNKHVPLHAQTGALNVIEEAIGGKSTKQVV